MTIYVDSGVLLKAYLEEAGSDRATDSRPRGGSGRERFPSLPSICVKHSRALILYLDTSALVKRYVAEPDSDVVRAAMSEADQWFIRRVGYMETVRAVGMTAGKRAMRPVLNEWPSFGIIELNQPLVLSLIHI